MSDKGARPLRGNARGWLVRGGDGMFHTVRNERPQKQKRKVYVRNDADMECCEHCPYTDFRSDGKTPPCLCDITYKEYLEIRERLMRRVSGGERLCDILVDVGVSYSTLELILRKSEYPTKKIQKRLKNYLEREKEKEHGVLG